MGWRLSLRSEFERIDIRSGIEGTTCEDDMGDSQWKGPAVRSFYDVVNRPESSLKKDESQHDDKPADDVKPNSK